MVVLLAGEAFFLGGGDDLAGHDQRGRRIVVIGRDSQLAVISPPIPDWRSASWTAGGLASNPATIISAASAAGAARITGRSIHVPKFASSFGYAVIVSARVSQTYYIPRCG